MQRTSEQAAVQVDPKRRLRTALGQFATGVTAIMTRDAGGALVGLTANSFTAVSLDPPMVLWSLRRAARCYEAFRCCDHFVINVLAQDQLGIAQQFSQTGTDRFAGVSWSPSPTSGLPVIDGASAWFECRMANAYDAGDHTIFVGDVLGFAHAERAPLVFHAGTYVRAPEPIES